MKTKLLFLAAITASSVNLFSQVGINTTTPNPSSILDVVSTNKGLLIPRVSLTGNTDVITIPNPANGLLVYNLVNAGGANPVKKDNFYKFNTTTNKWQLLLDETSLSTMAPAVFRLENNIDNFLNGLTPGNSSVVPMALVSNSITGLSYNAATSTITFPAGIFKMEFIYEGDHDSKGCTLSSYIVDFPDATRIHSTSSHIEGGLSNHGGIITYTASLSAGKTWTIKLGRGQSGNCTGTGNTLVGKSTELLIFKMN
ncbi:hypothetical protein [Chryseobacterium sp. BIGb0232]|uniref:hypothetical protein n=1 Tax=Chryseobacterium sp. BIGb0232 TaxID=2940598 RepID=UPI000F463064|nr:hypothetical protein [Chryseobacterium sp. BIGb0232]MCS4302866.1 hypothetical protein [Chryseobacterium sp. BIGb0232]ROS17518.1 hypothetical protein EDF65_1889 [Chryseobacterium nakagawai]